MKSIYINFKPSNILSILLISAGLGSVTLLFLVELSHLTRLLLAMLIVFCTIYSVINRALLLMPWSFVALRADKNNAWQLQCKDGRSIQIFISKESLVTAHLTILNFTIATASASEHSIKNALQHYLLNNAVVLLPDSMDAENFRQLRLCLRWP